MVRSFVRFFILFVACCVFASSQLPPTLFPPRASFAAYSPGEHRAGISKGLFASSLLLYRWVSSLSSAGAMFDADVSVAGVAALSVESVNMGSAEAAIDPRPPCGLKTMLE